MAVEPPFDLLTGNHQLLSITPQAGAQMKRDHLGAMLCPMGRETCVVDMLRGWLSFADTWGDATQRCIGEDASFNGVMADWKAIGQAMRALLPKLNEHLDICAEFGDPACRLNFATIDRMIVAAIEWQELQLRESA